MSYLDLLGLAAPEIILVVTVLAVLAADLLGMRGIELRIRLLICGMISCVGCLAAIGWMLALPQEADFLKGMLVLDRVRQVVQIGLLLLTIFTVLISLETDFTVHVGEYFSLILLATIGMMFLVSSEDILMIFLSLELTSLSLYILTAFNKRSRQSAEAALKYFLFGGMSAAFTLFGLSLLYGLSGSTNLGQISAAIRGPGLDPLLLLAIVTTVIGFGFKVAAAPFHLWAPDVYQGAPIPSAALIASGSKVASFFVFAKVMAVGFRGAEGSGGWQAYQPGWVPVLAIVAVISMVLGNLTALVQSSVRRLLAYSAIAHGGYMLLGVMTAGSISLPSLMYYAITYGLTTLGAFGVVSVVQEWSGGDRLTDFAGLSRRAPALAACMMVFMLSLAGIPPLAGFFGKFYIFSTALSAPHGSGLLWLVILAIAMSAISLYYYLQVLKQIYVADSPDGRSAGQVPMIGQAALVVLAIGVVGLGCAPEWLIGKLNGALHVAGL
ncbi:MAG TPA: NADH-quinone oxidoreductase subunit N [Candidatus Limnocylindrales bacterium]|nr:NADH-quinone oxidoreductase subunit N [Candidatus Limnocylindrales bacterium]